MPEETKIDHGRVENAAAKENEIMKSDPFQPLFKAIEFMQEAAIPLITGVVLAMILANAAPDWYKYHFTSAHGAHGGGESTAHRRLGAVDCPDKHRLLDDGGIPPHIHRILAGGGGSDMSTWENPCGYGHLKNSQAEQCFTDCEALKVDRMLLLPWPIFGHPVTLHFFANDLIMVFHFGIAVKEVTEALLPGGSLNPPSKAANPMFATMGGVFGPVTIYFILLACFKAGGMFDTEMSILTDMTGNYKMSESEAFGEIANGWGIVTATDIPLAWLAALIAYGEGHPAIDYLLLLAVADDALGMVIIAIFYTDPSSPVQPQWLLLVGAAMVTAWLMRKWHYRMERVTHQGWMPYVLICGTMSWIGLIKAKLHPALALVPIVPFMPGPNMKNLEAMDEKVEVALEDAAQAGTNEDKKDLLHEHHEHARGRGTAIQAGLYSGLVGHSIDPALMVEEYDEHGEAHMHASTLDEFEHFCKPYVDFGLFLFALCNAGVQIKGAPGAMTWVVLLSLLIGKYIGILIMYKISKKCFKFPAPLGIRTRHIRMMGLIAALGLTVALFVSDVAFKSEKLKDDARLGALLSGCLGFGVYAISRFYDFSAEDVEQQVRAQLEEEMVEIGAPRNRASTSSASASTGTGVQLVAKGETDSATVV